MPVSTANTDILTASLGKPVVLAYGRHVVGGNIILKDETDAERTIVFVALGEGEWDGIESLYVNGAPVDVGLPENFHFHKGLHGQLSSNGTLDPEGEGSLWPFAEDGDQQVDGLTPPGVQGLTFSRTAYLALSVPFDVFAPGPELSVQGTFRTRKVRFFNASGVETGYGYSENPAWQIADLLTLVRGLADWRLDWASFVDAAAYCEEQIQINGELVDRFQSHVAFTDEVDFDKALEAILATCRGHLLDYAGRIQLRIDRVRAPVFDFSDHPTAGAGDNIVEGSFSAWWKDTRAAANRLELLFRDIANDFQVMTKLWNHEPQQAKTGRIIAARVHLGNMPQQQAERIGNYLLTRAVDNNLFCRLRSTPASLALMPGDVVRVAHDAAPWGQASFGDARWESFEVVEVADNPDETRDFLLQLYRDTTYPDTAGPTQNLVGTTVRRRPGPPPTPSAWSLSVFPRGHLWLEFTIPRNADYRSGDLLLLADDELRRVETTLSAALEETADTMEVASSEGFQVGDFVNVGQEILKIMGPGVEGFAPSENTWQVAHTQKLSEAKSAASEAAVYRLTERHLHFVLPPGFTLDRPEKTHTMDFRPGRLRIMHAQLQFTGLGGVSEPTELPFWAQYEINAALFGVLPGLRASAGGLGTIQIPGPLATGTDLAMPLMLPEDVSIGVVFAEMPALKQPTGADVKIQLKIDGENYGQEGVYPQQIAPPSGKKQVVWLSGAQLGNVGGKAVSVEITQVGAMSPGEDLTVFVTV